MKAVVLAGGLGTRMRPLTFTKPKPMTPLVDKPVLEHIIDYLRIHGIDEVVVTTNYMRDQVREHFGHEHKGVKLYYPIEEQPLGTAGSVKNIQDRLDDTFVVIQGDNITDIDLTRVIREHKKYSGTCTITLQEVRDPWNYGVVELHENMRVKRFYEKPKMEECFSNLINTGLYVMEPSVLDYMPADTFFDFSRDLFPILLTEESIYGVVDNSFWIDVGQPVGYMKAMDWILSKAKQSISDSSVVAGEIQDNVVIGENVRIVGNSRIVGPVIIGDNTTVEEDCVIGPASCIGPNSLVKAGTAVSHASIFENTTIGGGANIKNCLIAEYCVLGSETTVQSNSLVGSNCRFGRSVFVSEGSRVWPNIQLSKNAIVSGTIKQFIQVSPGQDSPTWGLRTLSPEEAFYFNMSKDHHVIYTGHRARSITEFRDILKSVDARSIDYHFREDVNDFSEWTRLILSDRNLADRIHEIKDTLYVRGKPGVRDVLVTSVEDTINRLVPESRRLF